MLLRLPSNLHYPITITKVEVPVGEPIKLDQNLFLYSYTTKVTVGERNSDEEKEVEKTFVAHFPSTLEGTIQSWRVWVGDTLREPKDICEVEEECPHTVQFLQMCTNCGKDMTTIQPGGIQDTNRATIQPLHDTQYLTISQDEANEIDKEAKRRLLGARKLSLVVDLDQTIIHAAVDPTIAEWQKDKDNPNYDAVKDVRAFQLIDEGPGMRGCWYYIKLRPGLQEFLENISQLYELHIYTMGTRQYAQQIANIVDPDRTFFSDRILSRDESGSMVAKNLERLFPVDTKMVVIIDDRGDVWKWSANLIRVTPYDFFVGIGDINSSFLPKKQDIQATPKSEKKQTKSEKGDDQRLNGVAEDGTSTIQNGTSALETLVAMSGSDDPAVRELQSKGQEEIISSQLEEKPLLKMQQKLDERDEAAAAVVVATLNDSLLATTSDTGMSTQPSTQQTITEADSDSNSNSSSSSESTSTPITTPSKQKSRHSLLKNDDEELIHLEARLTAVHTAFYNEYDRKRLSSKGGRVAALAGKRKQPLPDHNDENDPPADLNLVPDVKRVMPGMKLRVLSGVVIVFSGVLPLGTDIQTADISTWAKTFGARITDRIGRDVTHVIAARAGTAKVKQAVKRGIKVVGTNWLIGSMQQWRKLDERGYYLEGLGQRRGNEDGSSDIDIEREADRVNLTGHDFMLSSSDGETSETGFGDGDGEGDTDGDDLDSLLGGRDNSNSPQKEINDRSQTADTQEDGQPPQKRLKLSTIDSTPIIKISRPSNPDDPDASNNAEDTEPPDVDDGSPITIDQDDWADMDAELKEFMGSEVDSESDNDSVSSKLSLREKRGNLKRRREEDDGKSEELQDNTNNVDLDNRRGKPGSALKSITNADPDSGSKIGSGSLPPDVGGNSNDINNSRSKPSTHKQVTTQAKEEDDIKKQQTEIEARQQEDEAEEEDSDDELARELERELEEGDNFMDGEGGGDGSD